MSDSKPVRITELEFGQKMLEWESKRIYPLESVASVKFEDKQGIFYVPTINDYVTHELYITGNPDGYESREQLLRCVGRCWDLAEADLAKRVAKLSK